ncbi:MAG: hypothetical protein IKU25_00390 [Clostridia bacterium]|nr:hypothetical protein [Clostridia bacterium]MBR5271843.1 hypothetical protein [Clostridia bacterium]
MKTEEVKLSQVKVNNENPRSITTEKFAKLVNSILVFPKMLNIRPVVVDNKMTALGGNMRLQALKAIAKMNKEDVNKRLLALNDFLKKSGGEKKKIVDYWTEWLSNPTIEIINAKDLTEDERKQFVIKDNVSFGTWDYDALANKLDNGSLDDWGMDVWNAAPTSFAPMAQSPSQQSYIPNEPDPSEDDNPNAQFQDALPPELQGLDLTPDKLPEIKGSDETAMERVIIVYPKERLQEVLNLLGLTALEKVVYRLEEILPEADKE